MGKDARKRQKSIENKYEKMKKYLLKKKKKEDKRYIFFLLCLEAKRLSGIEEFKPAPSCPEPGVPGRALEPGDASLETLSPRLGAAAPSAL